jgi:heptaprenyl diphosphate synthase
MIVQNIIDIVAEVKEQLQIELNHPYVKRFIHHPIIDEDKLLYLCSFLQHASVKEEQLKVYVVSVMLVQIALDTHDLVSTEPVMNDQHLLQERQLTVLAGVHYSSLYYYYLSKNGFIQFMRETASAIKIINVEKMKYYKQEFQSVDDMMNSLFVIETALIQSVCSYFRNEEWKRLLAHALFIKRLIYEKRVYINHGTSRLFNWLRSYLYIHKGDHQDMLEIVESYINKSRKIIDDLNSSLHFNEQLKMNLNQLIMSTSNH